MAAWRLGVRLLCVLGLLGVTLAAQAPVEFEVASIKHSASNTLQPGVGLPPSNPAAGILNLSQTPARVLATRAFTGLTTPLVVEGLPPWAESERWDVAVRFRPGATLEEQAAMWLALLTDRMKLQAHIETRPRPAYKLVMARADRRLGPQLRVSTLDCTPEPGKRLEPSLEARDAMMATNVERRLATPKEEAALLSVCGGSMGAWNSMYAGSVEIKGLLQALALFGRLDRPVLDETGLTGKYAVKLVASPATAGPGDPDAPPSLFSALQDQLGLKLEPTTIDGRILVVDHIERPTEN